MASPEDLLEDIYYADLKEDVAQECSKFGTIERLEIPRPEERSGLCCPAVGKVFIKFYYIKCAKRAKYKLNGRPYNNRTVVVSYFNEDEFERGLFLRI